MQSAFARAFTLAFISVLISVCALPTHADSELLRAFRLRVESEVAHFDHSSLPILFNGEYYFIGGVGRAHERRLAYRYASLVRQQADKKFLFLARYGSLDTPGIDGTVFSNDATMPERRVSFKTMERLQSHPSLRLIKMIRLATESANKHATLDGTFSTFFQTFRDEDLARMTVAPTKTFYNKIALLAAMGIKSHKRIPLSVVIAIEDTNEEIDEIILQLKLKLQTWDIEKPEQIVLVWRNRIDTLNLGVDYQMSAPVDCRKGLHLLSSEQK